jgi:hypothetical protein
MTPDHRRIKLRTASPPEGTTPSTTGNAPQDGSDSGTALRCFTRNSTGLSGKASRSIARLPTMPLSSRVIIDQLTPLLPKDNKEVSTQVKCLHATLDAVTMTDPTLDHGYRRRGQDPDHHQSPHRDSANNLSRSPHKHNQGQGDLRNIISNRDAHDWIKNQHQERGRLERERRDKWDRDFYNPYYDQRA